MRWWIVGGLSLTAFYRNSKVYNVNNAHSYIYIYFQAHRKDNIYSSIHLLLLTEYIMCIAFHVVASLFICMYVYIYMQPMYICTYIYILSCCVKPLRESGWIPTDSCTHWTPSWTLENKWRVIIKEWKYKNKINN